ncbi:MAG: OmpA family protein [Ferruginibacter sp.]
MKKIFYASLLSVFTCVTVFAQTDNNTKDYSSYDFLPGEKTLFEDNLFNDKMNAAPLNWKINDGEAIIGEENNVKFVSIKKYYTKLFPKSLSALPDVFTIEYDTWLDAGYDGNPGVEIHLMGSGDEEAVITPNRDRCSCKYPGGEENGETPVAIRGENFYNRWNHIAISYSKKSLTVYVNQFKVFSIPDCKIKAGGILVTGNTSQDMKILFKNFRVAKDIPSGIAKDLSSGLLITHAIKFDVNKYDLKPESMSVLNEIEKYLKSNSSIKLEIGGHTDSDGNDNNNLTLSQQRAEAVRDQLIKMGIESSRLSAKGFGETKPIDINTTAEGKANNRRVEFKKI